MADRIKDKAEAKATGYTRWRTRLNERFGDGRPERAPAAPRGPAVSDDPGTTVLGIIVYLALAAIITVTVFVVIPAALAARSTGG